MGDRLTAEKLDTIEQRIGSEFDNEATLTGDELRALLTELKERRAADLSSDEREALAHAIVIVTAADCGDVADEPLRRRALSALSKILKDGT
jgi:hypothetical protein